MTGTAPSPDAETGVPSGSASGERRVVTILFADIAGFTALAETLDPEPLRDLLNSLFDRLVPIVHEYGGSVDKFIGDCVMAVFGTPDSHDDDALRAIRAALEIRDAVNAFGEDHAVALAVHVGVNSGRVVVGPVGGGTRSDRSVIGDAVNVAKCLEEAAEPGEVLIGPETFRLVRDSVHARAAGSIAARGRVSGVRSYRVTGLRDPSRRWARRRFRSAMVGRTEEQGVLDGALERLLGGGGGALFVIGEAGKGKSRLLAEARQDSRWSAVRWVEGRTAAYGRPLGYAPFRDILQDDGKIRLEDGAEARVMKLSARLEQLVGERSPELLPYLALILGLSVSHRLPQGEVALGAGPGVGQGIFRAVDAYFRALAGRGPVVVVFEDLHWLDASSASLIRQLIPAVVDEPILFCLTSRPALSEVGDDLRDHVRRRLGSRCTEVHLAPLSAPDVAELMRNLLGSSDLPIGLEDAIATRVGGNPFFVEEMVRHLVDIGALRLRADGRWEASVRAADAELPGTLESVIAARVNGLPPRVREHLRLASVIGRSFSFRLLAGLAGPSRGLEASLAHLRKAGLIDYRSKEPDLVFAFKHALVQESTYETLLLRERKELHLRLAREIERMYPERLAELSGVLAFHMTKGEEWEAAHEYLLLAGDGAVSAAADVEAVRYYRQALSGLLRAFDRERRLPGPDDPVEWFVKRLEPLMWSRQLPDLLEPLTVFHQRVASTCGADDARTVAAGCVLAAARIQSGDFAAADGLLAPIAGVPRMSARLGTSLMRRVLLLSGWAEISRGRHDEAEVLLARAVDLGPACDVRDAEVLREAIASRSTACYFLGRLADARRMLEEGLSREDLAGDRPHWGFLLNLSSWCVIMGQLEQALAHARTCMSLAPNRYIRALGEVHEAAALHAAGRLAEADSALRSAHENVTAIGENYVAAVILRERGETLLRLGDVDLAEKVVTRAISTIEEWGPRPVDAAPGYWTLAGIAIARGRFEDAERFLKLVAEIADVHRMPACDPLRWELPLRWAQLRIRQARGDEARALAADAAAALRSVAGDGHPRLASMEAVLEGALQPA